MGGVAKIWSTRKQPESVSWFGFGVILVAEPPSSENWSSVYGRGLNLSEVSELVALQLMRSNRALKIDLRGGVLSCVVYGGCVVAGSTRRTAAHGTHPRDACSQAYFCFAETPRFDSCAVRSSSGRVTGSTAGKKPHLRLDLGGGGVRGCLVKGSHP